jgi:hypothetical protein
MPHRPIKAYNEPFATKIFYSSPVNRCLVQVFPEYAVYCVRPDSQPKTAPDIADHERRKVEAAIENGEWRIAKDYRAFMKFQL